MKKETLNICQVSLPGNIPIILENYKNFSNLYTDINFYIICPKSQVYLFKKKLNHMNIYIISRTKLLLSVILKKISNNFLKNKKLLQKNSTEVKMVLSTNIKN